MNAASVALPIEISVAFADRNFKGKLLAHCQGLFEFALLQGDTDVWLVNLQSAVRVDGNRSGIAGRDLEAILDPYLGQTTSIRAVSKGDVSGTLVKVDGSALVVSQNGTETNVEISSLHWARLQTRNPPTSLGSYTLP